MRRYILTIVVAVAVWFAMAVAGAVTLAIAYPGTNLFPDQILWWSLVVPCLAVPVAGILWKNGTVWMVGVITTVFLATYWVTAIASTGGMFFRNTVLLHPFAHFTAPFMAARVTTVSMATAAIVATMAMAVAWLAFSALGRQLSRHWTLPIRVLAVLGYWVLIGATITNPWVYPWVFEFYGDILAFPTTGLFMLMGGPFYPAEIYHVLLGLSLGLFLVSVGTMALVQRHRAGRQHALKP